MIKRGITLLEVLVAVAIVATLTAILWAVLAPSSLSRSRHASVTAGLRQCVVAFNIYRSNNDDKYPLDWVGMGFSKPNSHPDWVKRGARPVVDNPPSYPASWQEHPDKTVPDTRVMNRPAPLSWDMPLGVQQVLAKYTPDYPFDEAQDPMFHCSWMFLEGTGKPSFFTLGEHKEVLMMPGQDRRILASFLDGHVRWDYFSGHKWREEYFWQRWWGGLK